MNGHIGAAEGILRPDAARHWLFGSGEQQDRDIQFPRDDRNDCADREGCEMHDHGACLLPVQFAANRRRFRRSGRQCVAVEDFKRQLFQPFQRALPDSVNFRGDPGCLGQCDVTYGELLHYWSFLWATASSSVTIRICGLYFVRVAFTYRDGVMNRSFLRLSASS